MNENQHTPGPWATDIKIAADLILEGATDIQQAAVYVNHGSGKGGEVCALRHDPQDGLDLSDAEYQANARLIAAAPDLLAALQAILAQRADGAKVTREEWTAATEAGKAAIKKALHP